MMIEDGKGNGRSAGVDNTNRLSVNSVTQTTEHYSNHVLGVAYSLNFNATPTGAGDCFLYIKNTGENDITIEGFGLKLVANEYIDIKIGDSGSPIGGSNITPTNLNSASGKIAEGTFQNSNDITGLSGGTLAYRIYHESSAGTKSYNFEQDIILKPGGVLTFYCETGTTALAGFINFNYHGTQE